MKYTKQKQQVSPDTTNYEGGSAYSQSAELEFVSILLTSFLKDQFYRTEKDVTNRIAALMGSIDPLFAAKAAWLARHEFAMRSVSHYVAALVANRVKGQKWTKEFFRAIVRRGDDILEILSCYQTLYGDKAPLPNAMRKGLGAALSGMKEYDLAKYAKWTSTMKMVDAVNICHPQHTSALAKLIKGELTPAETWEVKLTQAGSNQEAKTAAWGQLLAEKKLGYMALIRNIRNILEQAPDQLGELCRQLVNEVAIKKSLILPFRFVTAIQVVEKELGTKDGSREVAKALVEACDLALANVPRLEGRTLVALDDSGSMGNWENPESPAAKGGLFAAALFKACNADFMLFSDTARYYTPRAYDPIISIARSIPRTMQGTNLMDVFRVANKPYDRIILLTDFQAWIGQQQSPVIWLGQHQQYASTTPHEAFKAYCGRYFYDQDFYDQVKSSWRSLPKVYCIDLQGYGTMQFPEKNVYALAGFSDRIFDVMKVCDEDPQALLTRVQAVEFGRTETVNR